MTEEKPAAGALVKSRVVQGEIVTAEEYNSQVAAWRSEGFNVLTPAVALSTIPRDHKIAVNRVQISPNPTAGEVYTNPLFTGSGEVALAKVALEKIAQCAGISIDHINRVDSGTVPYVWTYRVAGHWISFDGTRIDRIATKTLDLRDGSVELKGFKPNQIEQARRHGESVCESKAINRLYRQYGLKQKYAAKELADRPFIVLKLQWDPDMSNPIVAAIVTQLRAGATQLLYPYGMPGAVDPSTLPAHQVPPEMRPAGLPVHVEDDEDEPPVNQTVPAGPAQPANAVPFDEEPDQPTTTTPAEPTSHISGVFASGGKFFLKTVEAPHLVIWTDDKSAAQAAVAAKKADTALLIETEKRGTETWLVGFAAAEKL